MPFTIKHIILVMLAGAPAVFAQDAHWGVQGEGAYGSIGRFILDRFDSQLSGWTVNDAKAKSFAAGLVRFKANGSPSFSIQYLQMDADLRASRGLLQALGTGTVRGVMASKHLNFVSREHVSGGLIVGGGVGKGELDYTVSSNGLFPAKRREERTIPMFEVLGSIDIRPVKQLSIGPYYGLRNGFLVGGAAIRFHFR